MKRNSFNVLFFIKKAKLLKNGEASVCMRITVNGARVENNIRKSIEPALWNQAKECAKGKSRKVCDLNAYIENVEKSVQIDPCRRENVTLFVEIRLTLGDEIKMPPVGILRRGFFCSFRNPSPGTAGVNLKLQIYDYKIKKYPSMLPVGDGIKGNGRGFPYIP